MCKKLLLLLIFNTLSVFSQEKLEIFFDFDQYVLNQKATDKLNTWLADKTKPQVIKIYGYCDWKGTEIYNDSLSIKRAKEVYDFLKQNKVDINPNFELKGFGENFKQSKNQADNRKVIIFFEEYPNTDNSNTLESKMNNAKRGDKILLENIYFKNNSAEILSKSEDVLYKLLHILEYHPKLKIEIQGHICCRLDGDVDFISEARAKAIYDFLIQNKIERNRLTFKGFGTSNPVYPIPENSEQEKEANRRVEIMVVDN
jgi:outer membrane protein OmpA-like peptidoglycan-associated protein